MVFWSIGAFISIPPGKENPEGGLLLGGWDWRLPPPKPQLLPPIVPKLLWLDEPKALPPVEDDPPPNPPVEVFLTPVPPNPAVEVFLGADPPKLKAELCDGAGCCFLGGPLSPENAFELPPKVLGVCFLG